MKRYAVATLFAASLFASAPAFAQVDVDGYYLPMKVALKAAQTAIDSCATHGWDVTASVVDPAGLVIVQLRGDHATVHTKDSSYRKAYTIVSMGPVFGLTRTSEFIALTQKAPNGAGPELTALPDIFANAGGVAIKHGSEIVAGLGVGGSPGGNRDEACAADGVAAILNELN
ncbi:heme-binding protein [Acidisphaera sp. S103]|uniref:GlcG/HbpS family heme-binding protein n=1 Tax=Acidisphaera sp. S103 TaxID=1747223 RepID=UPI00131E4915|nr:heme-binding protein [Acidisphaera sp. S103]